MAKIIRKNSPESPHRHGPEKNADRLDFKQNLILWTVLRARDSDDSIFKQDSRLMLTENIQGGIITRDFLKPIYESLGMGENFDDRKLSPSIIKDELIPLDQELLDEEMEEQESGSLATEAEVEKPLIRPEEMPATYALQETILPSDDRPRIVPGNGTFEQARSIPRFEILTRLLLDTKFDNLAGDDRIGKEDFIAVTGRNSENMVRRQSYRLVLIKKLNKMVFVCNEEGNNTFVINGIVEGIDTEEDIPKLEDIYGLKKSQLRGLKQSGLLSEIRWSNKDRWGKRMAEALQKKSALVGLIEEWREVIGQQTNIETGVETAPAGWLTNRSMSKQLKKDKTTTAKITDKYRQEHPEWFKNYLDKTGVKREHFSPELIAIITETPVIESAPDNWVTSSELAKKLNKGYTTISKAIEEHRIEHPEWFKEYLDKGNRKMEYLSPELVAIITNELSTIESAPAGWLTNHSLANKLDKNLSTISNLTDKYRQEHPEWFKEYLDKINRKREHFSPELIKIIAEVPTPVIEPAPENWATINNLAIKLHKSHKTISHIAGRYRREHPEWFKEYLTKKNITAEHLSPELVRIITEIPTIELAPEDWVTLYSLVKKLKKSYGTIAYIAGRYRQEHPEWFKECLNKMGNEAEYLSPELVAVITKELPGKK